MIYTLTFNPALDYVVFVDHFALGETNRSVREELTCGGKGINVSIVLHRLGAQTTALGFLAGFTGRILQSWITDFGVPSDFITLPEGMSRINIKLKYRGETEINGAGPNITPQAMDALWAKLEAIAPGDTLVISGSIPKSLPADIYERILRRLAGRDIRFVVDATGALLANTLPYRPFLIKPNHEELGALCGEALSPDCPDAIVRCARSLQEQGAQNVLVSMGGAGSLLVTEDGQVLRQGVAQGRLINSVGAGDSMVAGFLAGVDQGGSYADALRLGTAAGGATAFSDTLATAEKIQALLETL